MKQEKSSIKLSDGQWDLMRMLRKDFKELKISSLNTNTYMALIRKGLVWYNDRYDAIRLTELGKTIEL